MQTKEIYQCQGLMKNKLREQSWYMYTLQKRLLLDQCHEFV